MAQLYVNNGSTLLVSDLLSTDTAVTLGPGEGDKFPQPDAGDPDEFFLATLQDTLGNIEIVKCPERVGDVITIERAQESTSALGFNTGSRFECRITAGSLDSFQLKAEKFDLRSGVIQSDGIDLWNDTDAALYQFYTLRYTVLPLFGTPVMQIRPPAGIADATITLNAVDESGVEKGLLVGPDLVGEAPAGITGKVRVQIPGVMTWESVNRPFTNDLCYIWWDEFAVTSETKMRLNHNASGNGAVRFAWSPRDVNGVENFCAFMEKGQFSCNWAIEVRNLDKPTYATSANMQMGCVANAFNPNDGDWGLFSPVQNGPNGDTARDFAWIFITDTAKPNTQPTEYVRENVNISNGLVQCYKDPQINDDLCRKSYVDAAISVSTVQIYSGGGNADGTSRTLDQPITDFRQVTIVLKSGTTVYHLPIVVSLIQSIGFGGSNNWVIPDSGATWSFTDASTFVAAGAPGFSIEGVFGNGVLVGTAEALSGASTSTSIPVARAVTTPEP